MCCVLAWCGGNCGPSFQSQPCHHTAIQGHHSWIGGTHQPCSDTWSSFGSHNRRKKGGDHQGPADHGTRCRVVHQPAMVLHAIPTQQVDVDKPLGLKLAQSNAAGGGIVVKSASGNASKAGIESGDTIIYCSSYFGDELWCVGMLCVCLGGCFV